MHRVQKPCPTEKENKETYQSLNVTTRTAWKDSKSFGFQREVTETDGTMCASHMYVLKVRVSLHNRVALFVKVYMKQHVLAP